MKAETAPSALTDEATTTEREKVDQWWLELSSEVQIEIAGLWDSRRDDASLAAESTRAQTQWHELPIQLRGRLVDEETRREDRMLKQQLFDYIVNHEEVTFFLEERTYHICRAHPAARAAVAQHSFDCFLRGRARQRLPYGVGRPKSWTQAAQSFCFYGFQLALLRFAIRASSCRTLRKCTSGFWESQRRCPS